MKNESTTKFPPYWKATLLEILLEKGFDAVVEKIEEYLEVKE